MSAEEQGDDAEVLSSIVNSALGGVPLATISMDGVKVALHAIGNQLEHAFEKMTKMQVEKDQMSKSIHNELKQAEKASIEYVNKHIAKLNARIDGVTNKQLKITESLDDLKANHVEWDSKIQKLTGRVTALENSVQTIAQELDLKANNSDLSLVSNRFSQFASKDELSKVDRKFLNTVSDDRIQLLQAEINKVDEQVSFCIRQPQFEAQLQEMRDWISLETSMCANLESTSRALKGIQIEIVNLTTNSNTSVNMLNDRIRSVHESVLSVQSDLSDQIEARARKESVDELKVTVRDLARCSDVEDLRMYLEPLVLQKNLSDGDVRSRFDDIDSAIGRLDLLVLNRATRSELETLMQCCESDYAKQSEFKALKSETEESFDSVQMRIDAYIANEEERLQSIKNWIANTGGPLTSNFNRSLNGSSPTNNFTGLSGRFSSKNQQRQKEKAEIHISPLAMRLLGLKTGGMSAVLTSSNINAVNNATESASSDILLQASPNIITQQSIATNDSRQMQLTSNSIFTQLNNSINHNRNGNTENNSTINNVHVPYFNSNLNKETSSNELQSLLFNFAEQVATELVTLSSSIDLLSSSKADISFIVENLKEYAHVEDTDRCLLLNELTKRQLQYLSITSFALTRLSLNDPQNSNVSRELKKRQRELVLSQMESLWHWVVYGTTPSNADIVLPSAQPDAGVLASARAARNNNNNNNNNTKTNDRNKNDVDAFMGTSSSMNTTLRDVRRVDITLNSSASSSSTSLSDFGSHISKQSNNSKKTQLVIHESGGNSRNGTSRPVSAFSNGKKSESMMSSSVKTSNDTTTNYNLNPALSPRQPPSENSTSGVLTGFSFNKSRPISAGNAASRIPAIQASGKTGIIKGSGLPPMS